MSKIHFNEPVLFGDEFNYIQEAYNNLHVSGDGVFTKKCQTLIEDRINAKKVTLTTSCTHALEMTALLLDIQPGDEIIVPSFTFVTTINAFVLRGAVPVFVDIRQDTLNIDENLIESAISEKTKAVVIVHYAGIGCEMDSILAICKKHNLHLIEDNAHGLFGKYKDQYLGTFGTFATQSFHETKNFSCGEGGALIINHDAYLEKSEIIREKGTNRSKFFRGMVDKYTWVDIGSSYLPSDILAAVLFSHLDRAEKIQSHRKSIWDQYQENLLNWGLQNNIQLPSVPTQCEPAYHLYYILLPDLESRTRMIQYLKENEIESAFHYLPLHTSEMGKKFGYLEGQLPVTENTSDRLLRLPLHNALTIEQQNRVIETILQFPI